MQKTAIRRRGGYADVIAGLKAYFKARGQGETLLVIRKKKVEQYDKNK